MLCPETAATAFAPTVAASGGKLSLTTSQLALTTQAEVSIPTPLGQTTIPEGTRLWVTPRQLKRVAKQLTASGIAATVKAPGGDVISIRFTSSGNQLVRDIQTAWQLIVETMASNVSTTTLSKEDAGIQAYLTS